MFDLVTEDSMKTSYNPHNCTSVQIPFPETPSLHCKYSVRECQELLHQRCTTAIRLAGTDVSCALLRKKEHLYSNTFYPDVFPLLSTVPHYPFYSRTDIHETRESQYGYSSCGNFFYSFRLRNILIMYKDYLLDIG